MDGVILGRGRSGKERGTEEECGYGRGRGGRINNVVQEEEELGLRGKMAKEGVGMKEEEEEEGEII